MSNEIQIDTLLDELFKKNMPAKAVEAELEKSGAENPAEEMALHIAAINAIKRYNVLLQVQQVHQGFVPVATNQAPVKSIRPKVVKWVMGIAASLLLILAGRFAFEYSANSSTKLYSAIYEPYNVNTDRTGQNTQETNPAIITAFNSKNYAGVIKIYEGLEKSGNREMFLAAYSFHQLADYQKAAALCELILQNNKTANPKLYNDEAEFYAALSYLKLKNTAEAAKLFKAIHENPRHTYYEKVTNKIMRRINWLK